MSIEEVKLVVMPEPPPEFQTEAEKTAYAFGWWKALESVRAEQAQPKCGAIIEVFGKDWRLEYMSLPVGKHKLYTQQYEYTSPPPRQPEPVIDRSAAIRIATVLGWTPPRQPLSDEQIDNIYTGVRAVHHEIDSYVFARAIEAACTKGEA